MGGIHERAEAGDVRHVLADELIDQAALAHLIVRMRGVVGTHRVQQCVWNGVSALSAHLLDVVFAVEQVLIDPGAARVEQSA